MKMMANLCTAALLFVSSMGFALPKVATDVLTEVKSVNQIILDLQNYESRFWAIGLNGDTLQPDQFQKFFAARDISFQYFVRSMSGVSIGDMGAYQDNREALQAYKSRIIKEELAEVERISQAMMAVKDKEGAVGLTDDGVQPDQFIQFFGDRSLEIHYYVRGPGFTLGDATAYEKNMQVLRDYAQKLKELDQKPDQQ